MTLKKCNQEGCDNSTDWVNRDTPRYSKGGYFRARCTSCSNLLSSYGINTVERDALLAEQISQVWLIMLLLIIATQVVLL